MANKATLITGLFKSRAAAEAAVDALIKRGYTRDDISVLMSDATKNKEFAIESGTRAADGAAVGGAVGGAAGGLIGALVGAGIPEHRAKVYDAGIRGGGILIGVESKSNEDADTIEQLL